MDGNTIEARPVDTALDVWDDLSTPSETGLGANVDDLVGQSPSLSSELARLVEEEGYVIERGGPGERTRADADERRIVVGAGEDNPVAATVLLADAVGSLAEDSGDPSGGSFVSEVVDEIRDGGGPDLRGSAFGLGEIDSDTSPRDSVRLNELFREELSRSGEAERAAENAQNFPNPSVMADLLPSARKS